MTKKDRKFDASVITRLATISAFFTAVLYVVGYIDQIAFYSHLGVKVGAITHDFNTEYYIASGFRVIFNFVELNITTVVIVVVIICVLYVFISIAAVKNFRSVEYEKLDSKWQDMIKRAANVVVVILVIGFLKCIAAYIATQSINEAAIFLQNDRGLVQVVTEEGAINNIDSNLMLKLIRCNSAACVFLDSRSLKVVIIPMKKITRIAYM